MGVLIDPKARRLVWKGLVQAVRSVARGSHWFCWNGRLAALSKNWTLIIDHCVGISDETTTAIFQIKPTHVDVIFSEIWTTLDSYEAMAPKKFLRAARSVMSCDPIDCENHVIGASPYDCDVIAGEIKRFADEKFAQFVPPMGSDWYLEKVKAYYRDTLPGHQYLSASELCALISIGRESEARARCEKVIEEFREGPGWPKPTGGFQLSSGETFIDMTLAQLAKSTPRQ